jgi:hypothetical protein
VEEVTLGRSGEPCCPGDLPSLARPHPARSVPTSSPLKAANPPHRRRARTSRESQRPPAARRKRDASGCCFGRLGIHASERRRVSALDAHSGRPAAARTGSAPSRRTREGSSLSVVHEGATTRQPRSAGCWQRRRRSSPIRASRGAGRQDRGQQRSRRAGLVTTSFTRCRSSRSSRASWSAGTARRWPSGA